MVTHYKIVVPRGDRGDEAPRRAPVADDIRVATHLRRTAEDARRVAEAFGVDHFVACHHDGSFVRVYV